MSSSDPSAAGIVGGALGKGCLAGLGLVVLYAVIGGLFYLVLGWLAVAPNIRMMVSIASGPIIGTVIGLLVALPVLRRMSATQIDDETQ